MCWPLASPVAAMQPELSPVAAAPTMLGSPAPAATPARGIGHNKPGRGTAARGRAGCRFGGSGMCWPLPSPKGAQSQAPPFHAAPHDHSHAPPLPAAAQGARQASSVSGTGIRGRAGRRFGGSGMCWPLPASMPQGPQLATPPAPTNFNPIARTASRTTHMRKKPTTPSASAIPSSAAAHPLAARAPSNKPEVSAASQLSSDLAGAALQTPNPPAAPPSTPSPSAPTAQMPSGAARRHLKVCRPNKLLLHKLLSKALRQQLPGVMWNSKQVPAPSDPFDELEGAAGE